MAILLAQFVCLQGGVLLAKGSIMADTMAMHAVLVALERGTKMIMYSRTRKPETKWFHLKLDTHEIVWYRGSSSKVEGKADLRLVKEIRPGKNAREFEKNYEDAFKHNAGLCFVIVYGSTFKLKTLALVASNQKERDVWVEGLTRLIDSMKTASYQLQVERWLRKEFCSMEKQGKVNLKDIKTWLILVDLKLPGRRVQDLYQEVRPDNKDLNYEEFVVLYRNLMFIPDIIKTYFSKYVDAKQNISLELFKQFLLKEQKESLGGDTEVAKSLMLDFREKNQHDDYFTKQAFLDFLFSEQNSIWNSEHSTVNQDMNQPLSRYWIASSHNTYLTGDQILSDSSTEAYARVLRDGCRCIELDCWDGPDDYPHIYHGHTLTSRIRFLDVLKTIKEYAFVASEYPLILSIENHCSLPQQNSMAHGFKDVFGDLLITAPLSPNESALPSPNQLKRKIIIKHKKIRDDGGGRSPMSSQPLFETMRKNSRPEDGNVDLSSSLKSGILYLEDPFDKIWKPHFFILTPSALYYTEETEVDDEEKGLESDRRTLMQRDVGDEDRYEGEVWYHGKIKREEAEKVLLEHQRLGNGTFLIRKSDTYKGEFSLSFLHDGSAKNHCRIQRKQEGSQLKFYLTEKLFDNLCDLIAFHQRYPLNSRGFSQVLNQPAPARPAHIDQPWFYAQLSRDEAEDKLCRMPVDGVFLIRQRSAASHDHDSSQFAISFRAEHKVKHCRITQDHRLYTLGDGVFESLVELVEFYQKHPLYRKMKLKYPLTDKLLQDWGTDPDVQSLYGKTYAEPNSFRPQTRVRALYDYKAQKNDELSFCKNAIISEVQKEDGGWWKGSYGGKKNCWFPVQFVEEVNAEVVEKEDSHPLGNLQQGSFDLMARGITISRVQRSNKTSFSVFRISYPNAPSREIAASSEEELDQWLVALNESLNNASKITEGRKVVETMMKITQELSDLIVYCIPIDIEKALHEKGISHTDMCSLAETHMARFISKERCENLMRLNQRHLIRVYPKGQRIDSSNYDPIPMWNSGCQLVSLNYQTPDLSMQLNEGLFAMNGHCGYVLKPACMTDASFSPFEKHTLRDVDPLTISLTIIGARHVLKEGRGIACSYVEVEVFGCTYDSKNKYKTNTKVDNGLNPVWNEVFVFDIINPDMALIRFCVLDFDMFSDSNFLGQAVFPIRCLKTGYRSIQLKSDHSEPLELASLLVHVAIMNPKEQNDEMYMTIQTLRDEADELQEEMESLQREQNTAGVQQLEQRLAVNQNLIFERTELRRKSQFIYQP